jgi:MFS family permease
MRKIVLTYGLIAGAILATMMVVTAQFADAIGFDRGALIGYTTMVAAFLMIFFGVKTYRDTVGGGRISFGRAVRVGAGIWIVAAVCYVATWQVVYRTMWPDFPEKYTAHTLEKARLEGKSEEQIAEQRKELERTWEMYRNPLVNIAFTFLEPSLVGLIMTLASAAVLSRRRGDGPGGQASAVA